MYACFLHNWIKLLQGGPSGSALWLPSVLFSPVLAPVSSSHPQLQADIHITPSLGGKKGFIPSYENLSNSHKSPRSHLTETVELRTHPWTNCWEEGDGNALISLEPREGLAPSELCGLTMWKYESPQKKSRCCH